MKNMFLKLLATYPHHALKYDESINTVIVGRHSAVDLNHISDS